MSAPTTSTHDLWEWRGALAERLHPIREYPPPDDATRLSNCSQAYFVITWYATTPIAILGVGLNVVVLLVWSVKPKSQPIVLFFKALAVMDTTFIISLIVWWYGMREAIFTRIMAFIMTLSQFLLVNITLLIGVWRWIAVFRDAKSRRTQSAPRARLALVIVICYCSVVALVMQVTMLSIEDRHVMNVLSVLVSNLLLSVPLLLLSLLSLHLVWSLCQETPDKVNPEISSTGHLHIRFQSRHSKSKVRRLTYTIVCVAVITFICYPVAEAVKAFYQLSFDPKYTCQEHTAFAVSYMLYVINSSVPFFIYFLFMLKFRKLFLLRFIHMYLGGKYNPSFGTTETGSEGNIHSSMGESMTLTPKSAANKDAYRHSLVVVSQGGTLTIHKTVPDIVKPEGTQQQQLPKFEFQQCKTLSDLTAPAGKRTP